MITLDRLREIAVTGDANIGIADVSSKALESCLFALACQADATLAEAIRDELRFRAN